MSSPELILASGSPRRRELLADAGYDFEVVPPRDGAEPDGLCSNCGPAQLVADLATAKLNDVLDQLSQNPAGGKPNSAAEGALVLAADTVAECGGQILGKPRDDDHATSMMQTLSGRDHRVFTGIALARFHGSQHRLITTEAVVTTLRMDVLGEQWVRDYVESEAWRGKAGGFGYQDGLGFVHVTAGSETNVVGLPMERVEELLAENGVARPASST